MALKSGTIFKSHILMLYSAVSLFWYFISLLHILKNAVLHRYIDGNKSSFFTAALEVCGNLPTGQPKN
jgi:hypothetical protein